MIKNMCSFICKQVGTGLSLNLSDTSPTLNFRHKGTEIAFPLEPVSAHFTETTTGGKWVLFLKVRREDKATSLDYGVSPFYRATFNIVGEYLRKAPNSEIDFQFRGADWPTLKALEGFTDQMQFDESRNEFLLVNSAD